MDWVNGGHPKWLSAAARQLRRLEAEPYSFAHEVIRRDFELLAKSLIAIMESNKLLSEFEGVNRRLD